MSDIMLNKKTRNINVLKTVFKDIRILITQLFTNKDIYFNLVIRYHCS